MGFLPMVFKGMWGAPFGPARPCDYVNVVGDPLPLPKTECDDGPNNEQVKAYHSEYVAALTALFEKHKAAYGMANINLRIVWTCHNNSGNAAWNVVWDGLGWCDINNTIGVQLLFLLLLVDSLLLQIF